MNALLFLLERRVEGDGAGLEAEILDEGTRLGGAVFAVHANVFPFDAERTGVAEIVERDDDFLEVDVAMAERAEVPVPARVAKAGMAAEDTDGAVTVSPPHVFHVDVVNPVAKRADEFHVVHALIAEMRRVV